MEEESKDDLLKETEEELNDEDKEGLEEELEEEVEEFSDEDKEDLEEELEEEVEEFAEDDEELEEIEEEAVEEVVEEAVEDVIEEEAVEDVIEEEVLEDVVEEEVLEDVVEEVVEEADEEVEEVKLVSESEYKPEPITEQIPEDIKKLGGDIQLILKDVDGDLIPFGYYLQKDKLVIKEDEAMKVKIVFSWFYQQNRSVQEISGSIKLSIDMIEKILINPIYFGKIYFEGALVKGNHEPILTETYCKFININTDEIEEKYLSTL
ncbi:MAG: hypothetical protein KGD64_11450 [Candidatus Heimdallarchaeota archaeon]|nr:hypothetical protein [Candidatus Heimdallarchaeota archaeon]